MRDPYEHDLQELSRIAWEMCRELQVKALRTTLTLDETETLHCTARVASWG